MRLRRDVACGLLSGHAKSALPAVVALAARSAFAAVVALATRSAFAAVVALAALPVYAALPAALHAQAADPADTAWQTGDTERAAALYDERLRANPRDPIALHRMALLRAWADRFDESLELFDRLLTVQPANLEARIDRARVLAWSGQPARAVAVVDTILAAHVDHLPALQARAQFAAWAGEYGSALQTYDRILAVAPAVHDTHYERARVLAWAARYPEAEAAYLRILEQSPRDVPALLGLAQVRAWAGRGNAAVALYDRVLSIDAGNLDALRGRARAAAWDGQLVAAERRWRELLAVHPDDGAALAGLAQTLRWQGRDAAALETVRRALTIDATNAAAREQLPWIEMAMRPRAQPVVAYEGDSDGNRIVTVSAGTGFRPLPRVEMRGDGYWRNADTDRAAGLRSAAYGGSLTLWTQIEPGWTLSAAAGASTSDRVGAPVVPTFSAGIGTPGRHRAAANLAFSHSALDATALLIEREVVVSEASASVSASLAGGIRVRGNAGVARFEGRESGLRNTRTSGGLALIRAVLPSLTLALQARAFGFDVADAGDGYFSPDFYGLAELAAQWRRERQAWAVNLEVAPGVQQVRRNGDHSATIRGAAGVRYSVRPGRSIGISAILANSGLNTLSPTAAAAYRYHAVELATRWTF